MYLLLVVNLIHFLKLLKDSCTRAQRSELLEMELLKVERSGRENHDLKLLNPAFIAEANLLFNSLDAKALLLEQEARDILLRQTEEVAWHNSAIANQGQTQQITYFMYVGSCAL